MGVKKRKEGGIERLSMILRRPLPVQRIDIAAWSAICLPGAEEAINTKAIKASIVGWKGLMYNLTLEGSKMSELDKSKSMHE
jgi:hypothetical protein